MCEWGETAIVRVKIPDELSRTGEAYFTNAPIDSCIAPIVKALQDAGIDMRHSCCGHGRGDGEIMLQDGRVLYISQKNNEADEGGNEQ